MTDIEIARNTKLENIEEIALKCGLKNNEIENYGKYKAKINEEAFPNAINLYNKEIMTGRGKGKYMYKADLRKDGEIYLREQMKKYFPNNEIMYVV